MSQSEEKKRESGPEGSSTPSTPGGAKVAGLVRKVVQEDGPERAPDATLTKADVEKAFTPPGPKKLSPAQIRAKRIKKEIEGLIESGTFNAKYHADPLVIKPLGAFAEVIGAAFAEMMATAESEPLDHFTAAVSAEHPDWHPDKVIQAAIQRFVRDRGRRAVIAAAKVSAEGCLMYELAGLSVVLPEDTGDTKEWAEKTLLPGEAMRLVRAAIEIGEVRDYLGESLSILGTEEEAAPEEEQKPTDGPWADLNEGAAADTTGAGPGSSAAQTAAPGSRRWRPLWP